MYEELLDEREIAPNALRSYMVDFYLTQMLDGGFAQYVFTAGDRVRTDRLVRDGLREIGASEQGTLFDELVSAFGALSADEADAYLDGDDDASPAVARLEALDERFEELQDAQDVVALNAGWLRGQEGLLALDDDGIEDEIARRVGLIGDLEERRAAANADDLAGMPEFELVIRELCDAAGHELATITMGDPNPADGAVLAAVEFENLDEGEPAR